MRTLIHLLILALTLTASTSTNARVLEATSHLAAAPLAQKLASGPSGPAAATDAGTAGLQLLELHQEIGPPGSWTASGFVVLVHNTCLGELRRSARGLRDLGFSRAERRTLLEGGTVDVAPGRLTKIHGIEPEGQAFINDLATEFRMARAFTRDPVTAVIGTRGRASLILTDGHHRRIAAMRAGMNVPVRLDLHRAHRWQEYEMHAIQYLTEGM